MASAGANTWDETANGGGDAGLTAGTAQIIAGNPNDPLTTITGRIVQDDLADVFAIIICDPASFYAHTGTTTETASTASSRCTTVKGDRCGSTTTDLVMLQVRLPVELVLFAPTSAADRRQAITAAATRPRPQAARLGACLARASTTGDKPLARRAAQRCEPEPIP